MVTILETMFCFEKMPHPGSHFKETEHNQISHLGKPWRKHLGKQFASCQYSKLQMTVIEGAHGKSPEVNPRLLGGKFVIRM